MYTHKNQLWMLYLSLKQLRYCKGINKKFESQEWTIALSKGLKRAVNERLKCIYLNSMEERSREEAMFFGVSYTDLGDYIYIYTLHIHIRNGPQRWPPYTPPTNPLYISAFISVQGTEAEAVKAVRFGQCRKTAQGRYGLRKVGTIPPQPICYWHFTP